MRRRELVSFLPVGLVGLAMLALVTTAVGCAKKKDGEYCVDGCGCTSDGKDPCLVSRDVPQDSGGPPADPTLEESDSDAGFTDAARDASHDARDAADSG